MPAPTQLPADVALVRTTPEWDETSLPDGLRRAHQVAEGVWGRMVVRAGTVEFVFEDDDTHIVVEAGGAVVIPPGRLHHVTPVGPATLAVEFYH